MCPTPHRPSDEHTIASWTPRGIDTVLDVPRPVEVWHGDRWWPGSLTALRREPTCCWGFVQYVVGVGSMHWQWHHEDELRSRRGSHYSSRSARRVASTAARLPSPARVATGT